MTPDLLLEIERALDHTLLKPDMTPQDLEDFVRGAEGSQVASLCIPPLFLAQANDLVRGTLPLCTVIGFPNGYATTAAKVQETKDAVALGAAEIDMVVPIGLIRAGDLQTLQDQVQGVRQACPDQILKIILETGALSPGEIQEAVCALNPIGPDFYKTSTGFNFPGASLEAVALIREAKAPGIAIKASGGIRTLADARAYLEAGVSRIGTSQLLPLIRQEREKRNG